MLPFDVVTESDDMVCNNDGMTILCKSFKYSIFLSCNRRLVLLT